jgi:predicted permease
MQVVVLMILMFLGVIIAKTKLVGDTGIKNITDLVLTFVAPCVIIKSFIREFDVAVLKNLLFSFLIAILAHILFIVLGFVFVHSKDKVAERVLRFGIIFSNCGFMSLPLQQALLGDEGVFYCSSYITIFQIFIWTYGVFLMSGDKKNLTAKKIVLNPGIIAFLIGFIIFVLSIPVPSVIKQPIEYMAALNTPLPMIIIGYHLASSNVMRVFKSFASVLSILLRLLILPFVAVGIMCLCGIKGAILISSAISFCAPVGAMTTMFASRFNADTELSVSFVSVTTLLSVITMPIVITLTQLIA